MQPVTVTVVSARVVAADVHPIVRADNRPRATIHLVLTFPITGPTDIWAAVRD